VGVSVTSEPFGDSSSDAGMNFRDYYKLLLKIFWALSSTGRPEEQCRATSPIVC
jgi:hypothetical protein